MPETVALVLGLAGLALVGFIRTCVRQEIIVGYFGIIPVLLVVWRVGGIWTLLMPLIAVLSPLLGGFVLGVAYDSWLIIAANVTIQFVFFCFCAWVFAMLRNCVEIPDEEQPFPGMGGR